jgi:hypothetical protein
MPSGIGRWLMAWAPKKVASQPRSDLVIWSCSQLAGAFHFVNWPDGPITDIAQGSHLPSIANGNPHSGSSICSGSSAVGGSPP